MTNRLHPKERKQQILDAAVAVAEVNGYQSMTRHAVATRAGVAPGLVSAYWGTMTQLRRAVMRRAIKLEKTVIIAQGLACGDDTARGAPPALKAQAAKTLMN